MSTKAYVFFYKLNIHIFSYVGSGEKKKLFAEEDISKLHVIQSNDTVGRKVQQN